MARLVGSTLLDRYFLRELVGSGGMADVYLSWDKLRSTNMAIKVLRRDLANSPQFFQSFAKEAELLRKLEHPNIVRLYEFERDGDIVFIVMDWVNGSDLRQAIAQRKKPFSLEEVSLILQPVCSALHFAHQYQVYHCDVKPANVLLHEDGRVLLTDFGVARLATEKLGGGTPTYMAPELFTGGEVNGRTDVYALGITIYEMLSGGQIPFRGDSQSSVGSTTRERIAWEHINLPLPPLRESNPRLPEAIENLVETALSKDPHRRFSTTMNLREAFEHARPLEKQAGGTTQSVLDTLLKPNLQSISSVVQLPPKPPAPKPPPRPKPSPRAAVSGPHLFGRSGEWANQNIPVLKQGLAIGRSRQSQLQLREPSVSRNHATLIRTRRGVYIRDENSSLGTYVNNQRITRPTRLRHGDVIRLGYYQVFEYRVK